MQLVVFIMRMVQMDWYQHNLPQKYKENTHQNETDGAYSTE